MCKLCTLNQGKIDGEENWRNRFYLEEGIHTDDMDTFLCQYMHIHTTDIQCENEIVRRGAILIRAVLNIEEKNSLESKRRNGLEKVIKIGEQRN